MARARMSASGLVEVPKALRDAAGLAAGGEVEITESNGRLLVEAVLTADRDVGPERKLTMAEFLAQIPIYEGPPVTLTNDVIDDAIMTEARRRWEKVNRQWDGHDND